MTTNTLNFRGHVPGLDVLRGAAVSMVLLYHSFDLRVPWHEFSGVSRAFVYVTSWGPTGVVLFFVLSGYLITGIVLDGKHLPNKAFAADFYRRRALRILPAYLLVLAIVKILGIVSWKFVLAALLFIANMASVVGASSGEYVTFWSLAVEEQFYLVWPWIVRYMSPARLAVFALGASGLMLAAQVVAGKYFVHVDLRYKLWGNAPSLMAGSLIAIGLRGGFIRADNIKRYIGFALVGVLMTAPVIYLVDTDLAPWLRWVYRVPFISAFVAALLLCLAHNQSPPKPPGVLGQAFVFLGYVSYGLYLIHQLVFTVYDRFARGTRLDGRNLGPLALEGVICISVSILLAYLSRTCFENLFLRGAPHSRDVNAIPAA